MGKNAIKSVKKRARKASKEFKQAKGFKKAKLPPSVVNWKKKSSQNS